MSDPRALDIPGLVRQISEANATIQTMLSGQIDAVVDSARRTPILLSDAQDALRESEERYRLIVETANEGIWTVDGDADITFVNRRFADMLGYDPEEMLGRSLFVFVSDAARARTWLQSGDSSRASAEHELGFVRRDGSELWALLRTTAIRNADGERIGVLAMMTDRSRRRQDEAALRKSEEQYRQIVETTTDGIVKSDALARILFVNRRFAEMLGFAPEEMIGVSLYAFMSDAARVVAADAFQRRGQGIHELIDTSFLHKNGTEIAVNIAGSPLFDAAGVYVGNLGMIRDVTDRKKLQAQLLASDRMASVGILAAGVAHEINNPLTAVVANLDYIADSVSGTAEADASSMRPRGSEAWFQKEIKEPLDDAREAAQQVQFIVRDLKIFSHSAGDEPRGPVDVEATMESSLRMGWNEIRHRARLVKQYSSVPAVRANDARLGQVFLNLVVNAAQAIPEGQAQSNEICVSTRLEGQRVLVEVSDTGPGMPPEIVERVFDAFFTTKAAGVGTGLGLAICRHIVNDLGGELSVRSEMGKGATFRVALPIAIPEEPTTHAPEQQPVAGRRGRILLVDDEVLVLRSVQRMLAKEHEVVAMSGAKDALQLCAAGERFDLILCDLMMPDMTGMDLHGELARIAPEQANRMLFLTGGAFTANAQRFLTETPMKHLEKPFDPANLRAIVGRLIQ